MNSEHAKHPRPPAPEVNLVAINEKAAIDVLITNPPPGHQQLPTDHCEIFINDGLVDGETCRARDVPPNSTWRYWTPRSGVDYEGRIRVVAVAPDGTTSEE